MGPCSVFIFQFPVLHTRGSSIGGSRITRRAYVQSYYVQMMDEAIKIWKELQRKSGMEFYKLVATTVIIYTVVSCISHHSYIIKTSPKTTVYVIKTWFISRPCF